MVAPSCPICLCDKNSSKMINLGCGHQACLNCSYEWFSTHDTCPMCRKTNDVFDKSTRSDSKAFVLLLCATGFLQKLSDTFQEENTPMCDMVVVLSRYLRTFFLDHPDIKVWNRQRRCTRQFMEQIKNIVRDMDVTMKIMIDEELRRTRYATVFYYEHHQKNIKEFMDKYMK